MVWSNSIMGFGSGVCCGSNYGGGVEERIYGRLGLNPWLWWWVVVREMKRKR